MGFYQDPGVLCFPSRQQPTLHDDVVRTSERFTLALFDFEPVSSSARARRKYSFSWKETRNFHFSNDIKLKVLIARNALILHIFVIWSEINFNYLSQQPNLSSVKGVSRECCCGGANKTIFFASSCCCASRFWWRNKFSLETLIRSSTYSAQATGVLEGG